MSDAAITDLTITDARARAAMVVIMAQHSLRESQNPLYLRGSYSNRYFLSQNEAIASGEVEGIQLNLKTMGVGNGLVVCAI